MVDKNDVAKYQQLIAKAADAALTEEELVEFNRLGIGQGLSGLDATLQARYLQVSPEGVRMTVEVTQAHTQPWGLANGGLFAALGESAGSTAGFVAAGGKRPVVGANNNTDFYRPAHPGDVITSEARPIHLGRTSQVWEIRHEANGKLLSRTNLRLAVLAEFE